MWCKVTCLPMCEIGTLACRTVTNSSGTPYLACDAIEDDMQGMLLVKDVLITTWWGNGSSCTTTHVAMAVTRAHCIPLFHEIWFWALTYPFPMCYSIPIEMCGWERFEAYSHVYYRQMSLKWVLLQWALTVCMFLHVRVCGGEGEAQDEGTVFATERLCQVSE